MGDTSNWTSPDIMSLATTIYNEIWYFKDVDAEKKKENKKIKLNIGQRHAPAVNRKGSEEGLQ
eukprot:4688038-Ditylum_brightwellii.AAC.1